MLFDWFDAKECAEFGEKLANEFIARLDRLPTNKKTREQKFIEKEQKFFQRMALLVQAFKEGRRLNVYKKARLGNAFKWTLRDSKFDPDTIDQLIRWLMLEIG